MCARAIDEAVVDDHAERLGEGVRFPAVSFRDSSRCCLADISTGSATLLGAPHSQVVWRSASSSTSWRPSGGLALVLSAGSTKSCQMAMALRPRPSAATISSRSGSHALTCGARPDRCAETGAASMPLPAAVAGEESVDTSGEAVSPEACEGGRDSRRAAPAQRAAASAATRPGGRAKGGILMRTGSRRGSASGERDLHPAARGARLGSDNRGPRRPERRERRGPRRTVHPHPASCASRGSATPTARRTTGWSRRSSTRSPKATIGSPPPFSPPGCRPVRRCGKGPPRTCGDAASMSSTRRRCGSPVARTPTSGCSNATGCFGTAMAPMRTATTPR